MVLRAIYRAAILPLGGRGGTLYRVTNLNAKGPGILADAVREPSRIVVFGISGTIDLHGGKISIRQLNITIAGQTAPGERICILRRGFIREGDSGDAMNIKCKELHDIIADHVSASWATDENLTLTNAQDVTMQYSISAEALDYFNLEQSPARHAFGSQALAGGRRQSPAPGETRRYRSDGQRNKGKDGRREKESCGSQSLEEGSWQRPEAEV